jgi:hypothetical protein
MSHYVYEIRLGALYYIGCRSCECDPQDDVGYMGSGIWCLYSFHSTLPGRVKTILSVWPSREQASDEEARLIAENRGKVGCMNRRTPRRRKIESAGA